MGASRVVATAFLVAMVACGRSSMHKPGDARPTSNAGGSGSGASALGGATTAVTNDAGTGGAAGTVATGGTFAIAGSGGSPGSTRGGGAPGSGGRASTGGTQASAGSGAGGRISVGGSTSVRLGSGGRATPDAAAGGSVGRDGGAPDLPHGPDLPVPVGGVLGTDAADARGGAIGTGGSAPVGGAAGTGASSARGGTTGGGGVPGSGGVGSGGATLLGGTGGAAATCGDGRVGPGEQCDLGTDNQASPAFQVSQADRTFAAVPLIRPGSGADFYSYSSASAHTGLEAPGMSRIMLHLDPSTRVLSLVVFHGVDQDSSGLEQPSSRVQLLFSGLPDSTSIEVSDDSNELLMTSATTATGLWNFTNNSDGGVLQGLPLPGDWTITVEPFFIKGSWAWTWIEGDGTAVDLDATQPVTIQARSTNTHCRPDCTIPQCGDGILDGGEVCDDGQPSPSGCSLNCMSFN